MDRHEIVSRLLTMPEEIAAAETDLAEAAHAETQREAAAVLNGEAAGKNELERKAALAVLLAGHEQETARRRIRLHALQNELAALKSVARLLAGGGE